MGHFLVQPHLKQQDYCSSAFTSFLTKKMCMLLWNGKSLQPSSFKKHFQHICMSNNTYNKIANFRLGLSIIYLVVERWTVDQCSGFLDICQDSCLRTYCEKENEVWQKLLKGAIEILK